MRLYIYICHLSVLPKLNCRLVDLSTCRPVDLSTYKIGRRVLINGHYCPNLSVNNAKIANTNPNLTITLTGSFLLAIALGRQVDKSTGRQVDNLILAVHIHDIYRCLLLTIALGRQVDKSTSRQVDKSTSRQINIAKIYKWIGRYSPSGTTRTKCMMGNRTYVAHLAVNT